MGIFVGLIMAFAMMGAPVFLQYTAYQNIDESKFKLYKIKYIGFLFRGMQDTSASTHGVILPMLIIQIQGYVLGVISIIFIILNEKTAFMEHPELLLMLVLFSHLFLIIMIFVITGYISKKRQYRK